MTDDRYQLAKEATVSLYPTTTAFLVECDNGQTKVSVLNVAGGGDPLQVEATRAKLERLALRLLNGREPDEEQKRPRTPEPSA